jgi:DNA mismatch endonuclease, patch repair protein
MAAIKGKNTKPELLVRSWLHKNGFRFRLHRKDLPGKPDIVLPKFRTVIFVHGCFWHSHGCKNSVAPKTRASFWRDKLEKATTRDEIALNALDALSWRSLVVWECEVGEFSVYIDEQGRLATRILARKQRDGR